MSLIQIDTIYNRVVKYNCVMVKTNWSECLYISTVVMVYIFARAGIDFKETNN